jgi:hypothetical protein
MALRPRLSTGLPFRGRRGDFSDSFLAVERAGSKSRVHHPTACDKTLDRKHSPVKWEPGFLSVFRGTFSPRHMAQWRTRWFRRRKSLDAKELERKSKFAN